MRFLRHGWKPCPFKADTTQGLKPGPLPAVSARVNSCPDTKARFFRGRVPSRLFSFGNTKGTVCVSGRSPSISSLGAGGFVAQGESAGRTVRRYCSREISPGWRNASAARYPRSQNRDPGQPNGWLILLLGSKTIWMDHTASSISCCPNMEKAVHRSECRCFVPNLEDGEPAETFVLLEGDKQALSFLGNLILKHLETDVCNLSLSPLGAGSSHFSTDSNVGIYLHRVPCEHGSITVPSE